MVTTTTFVLIFGGSMRTILLHKTGLNAQCCKSDILAW